MQKNDNITSSEKLISNFTLFDLNLKASHIKNCYAIRNSLNSLVNFVEGSKLRFSNP